MLPIDHGPETPDDGNIDKPDDGEDHSDHGDDTGVEPHEPEDGGDDKPGDDTKPDDQGDDEHKDDDTGDDGEVEVSDDCVKEIEGKCEECQMGSFLHFDDTCHKCNLMLGCYDCKDEDHCTQCHDGYYLQE